MDETVVVEEQVPVDDKEVLLAALEEEAGPEGEGDEKEEEEEVEESIPGTEVTEETRRASDEPMEGKVGLRSPRSCDKQDSAARSHACHNGCCAVETRRGMEVGVQLNDLRIRSANRKFRNRDATSKSCLKSL